MPKYLVEQAISPSDDFLCVQTNGWRTRGSVRVYRRQTSSLLAESTNIQQQLVEVEQQHDAEQYGVLKSLCDSLV